MNMSEQIFYAGLLMVVERKKLADNYGAHVNTYRDWIGYLKMRCDVLPVNCRCQVVRMDGA